MTLRGYGARTQVRKHHAPRCYPLLYDPPKEEVFTFLDLRKARHDGDNDTKDEIDADKELVDLAVGVAGVEDVQDDDDADEDEIEEDGKEDERHKPTLVSRAVIILEPAGAPAVSEIHDQNQLNEDEEKATNCSNNHPRYV